MRIVAGLGVVLAVILPGNGLADAMSAVKRAKAGEVDATAEISCAQEVGQALGFCTAKVTRDGEGVAVIVTFRNGFSRILTFEAGAFLRGNTTMSGVGTDTEWTLEDGMYRIRVDDQRFDIPETLIAVE